MISARFPIALWLLAGLLLGGTLVAVRSTGAPDPLGEEIARARALLAADTTSVGIVALVRPSVTSALDGAAAALARGRRALALQRLAAARTSLEAARSAQAGLRADGDGVPAFEAAWKREGSRFASPSSPADAAVAGSAILRALAQTSSLQARENYAASLDYGRATSAESGRYYLGLALAQQDFARFVTRLEAGSSKSPATPGLAHAIAGLRRDVLAAYRPPHSIERHPDFIVASSLLKEAGELERASLDDGALLRTLQAALRFAPLRTGAAGGMDSSSLGARLAELAARLEATRGDHSIAELFLEVAAADRDTTHGTGALAHAVVEDVLPRYFAALAPAPVASERVAPEVTVTLVRWPFT